MTQSRKNQVDLESTPFYHCYVRCVRRAYLCGEDHVTGENYDHRKQWLVSRLRFLSYIYAVDICAYAIMSNHYHVVVHVDKARAESWSNEEVAERWMQLYKGHILVDRWLENPASVDSATLEKVEEIIAMWRERLYGIDWFMRGVNETIARMANAEEKITGRFWEGRYKSQALLDEAAVLTCMAYVDLNPVRADMTDDIATSDFTSIQQRLFDYAKYKPVKSETEKVVATRVKSQKALKEELDLGELPEAALMRFDGSRHTDIHTALPFTREDYFDLVDATGRVLREDKRGAISGKIPPILARVGIQSHKWIDQVQNFSRYYGCCAGSADKIVDFSKHFDRRWGKGVGQSKRAYG